MDLKNAGFKTRSVHAGSQPDGLHGAVSVPIYQSSTFAFDSAEQGAARFSGEEAGYIYTRMGNPTVAALEEAVASLEGGHAGLATSSGMAAICAVLFTYLEAGAHLVGTDCVYGPSRVIVEKHFRRFGVQSSFVDTSDLEQVRAAVRPETRLLYIETPENPTIRLTDIHGCAEIAREHGLLLVVDNTFATPVLQRPLELGADIVVHSMTKYLGGHSDVVGGICVTADDALADRLRFLQNAIGAQIGPMDSFLVMRGTKTLAVRMERHCDNAEAVAAWLGEHPKVRKVFYPGRDDHPGHAVAKGQMRRFGGMVSFDLDADLETATRLASATRLFALAESLGGVESLLDHPASMTHASVPREERLKTGFTDGLLRLSVGIEDLQDLLADLEQAFDIAFA